MQELSDKSDRFIDLFVRLAAQNGLKTAAACREFGISRSIYYDIQSGKREVTPKMEARLRKVAQLPQNKREEISNSLEVSDMSENCCIEDAAVMRESDAKFSKRLDGLERAARHYFEDATEVFKEVRTLPSSGSFEPGQAIVLKGMAKSLGAFQPWIEQGFTQLLNDNRILRRIAKERQGDPSD